MITSNRILFAAAGLIAGAAITVASHGIWHDVEPSGRDLKPALDSGAMSAPSEPGQTKETSENNASTAANSSSQNVEASELDHETSSPSPQAQSPEPESVPDTPAPSLKIVLQEPYASMLAPRPATETMSMSELYEAFSSEARDEVWAYPMEMGIQDFSARRAASYSTNLEFVGCQSRYCLIAGVVYGGGQSDVNGLFTEMTQTGWWQSYSGHATTGSNDGEDYRFVAIFPRNPEFVMRK